MAVGTHIDYGAIFTGYLGLFLAGCVYAAMGIFASSLTDNQVVAFIIAIFLGLNLSPKFFENCPSGVFRATCPVSHLPPLVRVQSEPSAPKARKILGNMVILATCPPC